MAGRWLSPRLNSAYSKHFQDDIELQFAVDMDIQCNASQLRSAATHRTSVWGFHTIRTEANHSATLPIALMIQCRDEQPLGQRQRNQLVLSASVPLSLLATGWHLFALHWDGTNNQVLPIHPRSAQLLRCFQKISSLGYVCSITGISAKPLLCSSRSYAAHASRSSRLQLMCQGCAMRVR